MTYLHNGLQMEIKSPNRTVSRWVENGSHATLFFFFFLLQRYLNRPRNNKCLKVRTCTSQLISPLSTLIFDSDLNLNSVFNMDKFRTMDMPLNLFKLSGFSLMQKARKQNVFPMTLLSELRLYVKCLIECL